MNRTIFVSPANLQLGHFTRFLPRALPFGAGLLAARLRRLGEPVELWDLEVASRNDVDIVTSCPGGGEGVVFALSCMTANIAQGYSFAARIRKLAPKARIIFGGIHATALPEEVLAHGFADAVVCGEGEEVLPEVIARWNQDASLAGIRGVAFRDGAGKSVLQGTAEPVMDLDAYPQFPFDLVDRNRYHLGMVQTSRGCPYNCIFCSQRLITGRRFRARGTQSVADELEFLVKDCGQSSIQFMDDYFTANPERVVALCGEIRRRRLDASCIFGAQTRADSLTLDLLREMKGSGFRNLSFGFETASEPLMKMIDKKETVARIAEGVRLAQSEGFSTEGVFIFGFPGERLDDRLLCFRLASDIALDRARFNNVIPYPGTRLYETAVSERRLTVRPGWSNFNSAGATSAFIGSGFTLPYVPDGTSDRALQGDVLLANSLFYFNPRTLARMLTPSREPSGIGFEFTFRQMLDPARVCAFLLAVGTMAARALWAIISESECRRFAIAVLARRFPRYDGAVEDALAKKIDAGTVSENPRRR